MSKHGHSSGAHHHHSSHHAEGGSEGHAHHSSEHHLTSKKHESDISGVAEATGERPIHAQAVDLLTSPGHQHGNGGAHESHESREAKTGNPSGGAEGPDAKAIKTATSDGDHVLMTPLNMGHSGQPGRGFIDITTPELGMTASSIVKGNDARVGGGGGGALDQAQAPGTTAQSAAASDKPGTLDATKSVKDLIANTSAGQDVKFVDQQSDANDQTHKGDVLQKGQIPKIDVQLENKDPKAPKQDPDFIIKKDGTVEVLHDPEKGPDAHITVQVQRDDGSTAKPTDAQQKAIDELVPYLAQRVQNDAQYNQLSGGKVQVDDAQHLVSDKVSQGITNDVSHPPPPDVHNPPVPNVPSDVGNVSGRMNRVHGSNGGHESFAPRADGTIPERSVPPAQDNTPPVQAVEDTISALSGADKQHPYEYVTHRSDGGYGVGRYAMGYGNFGGWLAELLGIDLGNPPDLSKLQEYLKEHPEAMKELGSKMQELAKDHKVSQQFADQFKNPEFAGKFVNAIGKLQGNQGPISAQDMKQFFPKELQETVAQDRVQNYARALGINTDNMQDTDPGKLALSMYLGRPASQSDLSNPAYQNYMQTADNVYKLARAGQFSDGRIDVTEQAGKLIATAHGDVGQQLWAQTPWASVCEGGNLGCAASISKILEQAGVLAPNQGSASVEGLRDLLVSKGWKQVPITDMSQYRPGDVVYGLSGAHGHIGMIGEVTNGQVWEYDNSSSATTLQHRTVQQGGSFVPINNGRSRFGHNLYVLRPPGSAA